MSIIPSRFNLRLSPQVIASMRLMAVIASVSARATTGVLASVVVSAFAASVALAQTPAVSGSTSAGTATRTTPQASTTSRAPFSCGEGRCGWHFYDERLKEPDEPNLTDSKRPAPAPLIPPRNPKLVAAEKFQQEIKDAMAIAVYEPTPTNVLAWAALKHKLISNADTMSDVHQRVMWNNPQLDFSVIGRPVSQVGMATFDDERKSKRQAAVAYLSKTHVLYYFARSDCPYCKAFSPMLKAFSDVSGLRVYTISADGGPIPHFPGAAPDAGISERLGVFSVPALFIADPISGNVWPIGYGALSDDEILQRLDAFVNVDVKESAATPLRSGASTTAPAATATPRTARLSVVGNPAGKPTR